MKVETPQQDPAATAFISEKEPVEKELNALTRLMRENKIDPKCLSSVNIIPQAGRKLSKGIPNEEVLAFLRANLRDRPVGNVPSPIRCSILAVTRPFEEWGYSKVSTQVQNYVNALSKEEVEAAIEAFTPNTAGREAFLSRAGVDTSEFSNAQALNPIIKAAFARWMGALKAAESRLEKTKARNEKCPEHKKKPEVPPLTETGHLTYRPGINTLIYVYDDAKKVAYDPKIHTNVPYLAGNRVATPMRPRLDLLPGEKGYVPAAQREQLSDKHHRRQRAWFSSANFRENKPGFQKFKANASPEAWARYEARKAAAEVARAEGALPIFIGVGSEGVVIDGRGLLRAVRRHKKTPYADRDKDIDIETLLEFVTGCPTIDPKHMSVTFNFEEKVYRSANTVKRAKTKKALENALANGSTALLAIDLGQTHVVASATYTLSKEGDGPIEKKLVSKSTLPEHLEQKVAQYRKAYDTFTATIEEKAFLALPEDQRAELLRVKRHRTGDLKALFVQLGGEAMRDLPWEDMSNTTHYISTILESHGVNTRFLKNKKGRKGKHIEKVLTRRTDLDWYKWLKPKAYEANEALQSLRWDLLRKAPEFTQLSKRKLELSRECANYLLRKASEETQCSTIAIAIEDLTVAPLHGGGKAPIGWDNFGNPKSENRWFMQVMHKALSDLAINRGELVLEVFHAYTSQTCPSCGYCDKANRSGVHFRCRACKKVFHADLDVATSNIAKVAISGKPLPGPRKRSGAAKTPEGARKAESPEDSSTSSGLGRIIESAGAVVYSQ